jgi:hypothetical protein
MAVGFPALASEARRVGAVYKAKNPMEIKRADTLPLVAISILNGMLPTLRPDHASSGPSIYRRDLQGEGCGRSMVCVALIDGE